MPTPPRKKATTATAMMRLLNGNGPTPDAARRRADALGLPMYDPQQAMLPNMVTIAEAPDALTVAIARQRHPELQRFPLAMGEIPTTRETVQDIAAQPFVAASGLVSRFGEGAARKLNFGAAADAIRDNQREVEEIGRPTTSLGSLTRVGSELGSNALPYIAAGPGALGMMRSAALTSIESAADNGSLVRNLANVTGNRTLQRLADSPWRGAADVGIDMSFNMIPGLWGMAKNMVRGVDDAETIGGVLRQFGSNTKTTATAAKEAAQGLRQAIADNPKTALFTLGSALSEAAVPSSSAFTSPFMMGAIVPTGRAAGKEVRPLLGRTMTMTEAIPGSRWGIEEAAGAAEAYPRTRMLYSEDQLEATLRPVLKEIDKHFNLSGKNKTAQQKLPYGFGSYEGTANRNVITSLPETVGGGRAISPLEKDAVTHGLAFSQRQNSVPWLMPHAVGDESVMKLASQRADHAATEAAKLGVGATGLVVIPVPKAMNAGQAEAIAAALKDGKVPFDFTQVQGPKNAYIIFGNFSRFTDSPVSDAAMLEQLAAALNGHPVWEKVTPGKVQPYFARAHGNYLEGNADEHLAALTGLQQQSADPDAALLAGRLAAYFNRNTPRLRGRQAQIDRAYRRGFDFDQQIRNELAASGQQPKLGLDAPYAARSLHPSLLERGDPSVPLLDNEGRPQTGAIPFSTSPVNVNRSLAALERAFAQYPNPVMDPTQYKSWGSQLFGPVIPARPTQPAAMAHDLGPMRSLLGRLDQPDALGPAKAVSQMGLEKDAGMDLARSFREAYDAGSASPVTSLMLYGWGSLSKRASVAPHETAFLDLLFAQNGEALQPILERVARGTYGAADKARLRQIAKKLPAGAFSRQVTSNINALADGLGKMAQPARLGRMVEDGMGGLRKQTNAEVFHDILADKTLTDEQYLREFQRNFGGTGIGIDNKVASFIGLTTGRTGLLVPDRVQTALQWQAPETFANSDLASNIYEKGGIASLFKGAQGTAMQEAIQRGLGVTGPTLYQQLGRPGQYSPGDLHWGSWVASSDQEVGHGSLDLIRQQAHGGITDPTSLVKEGQLDKFRYGEIQGVLNGERVYGFVTSDGKQYVMPRDKYMKIANTLKGLAPKGFEISENFRAPYWMAPGYPADLRDALIRTAGRPVSALDAAGEALRAARAAEDARLLRGMAKGKP